MREPEVHRPERDRSAHDRERIEPTRGSRERIPDGGGRRIELREEIPPPREVKHDGERERERDRERERPRH